jgi:nucleoside diphosphate kinase
MYFRTKLTKPNAMSGNRTFTMVKPDAVENGHMGNIIADITAAGFKVVALRYLKLSSEQAGAFMPFTTHVLFMVNWLPTCHPVLLWQLFLKKKMRLLTSVR